MSAEMAAHAAAGAGPAASLPQEQQQHAAQLDAASIKLTRGTSCVLCQQRKVRCDKNKPCANCVKAGVECRIVPPQPPRRRKKRLQEKDLIERLKKYEILLSEHGVKFDAITPDLRGDGSQLDDVDELENDFEGLKTTPEASSSPGNASQADQQAPGTWFPLHKEFRASEHILHDSSDDEDPGVSTIHRAFDQMFTNADGFPFVVGGQPTSVTDLHPSTLHTFQLWQIYIDNINTLLKITHVPTVQAQIIEATSQLHQAPKNIEALMFGIYLSAITSLDEEEVQRRFQEDRRELLSRYFHGCQQALINAGFMRMNDPICLQAFVLYLLAVRWFVDPRQVFCLIGIAVRIAQRMGLHRDPAGSGFSPYEVEQRRRLWWTIVGYDRRIGEITGSTVTALSTGSDCKSPLNVNDSDLHIDGKELPKPHSGPTEMLFAMTRVELSMAVASNSNRDSFKMNNPDKEKESSPASGPTASPAKPVGGAGPTIKLAGQDGTAYTLEGFCAHIEGTYLSLCDPKIPLHFFTLTLTRQALCKMRVMSFLVRLHDSENMPLKEVERDNLFTQAIQMIEYDNVVQSSDSLKAFRWYAIHYFPFPAYMFLIQELRIRVSGPLVERAWEAVGANHDLRVHLNYLHSPMHRQFASHFLKSWDLHEEAQLRVGKQPKVPHFITLLREQPEKNPRARGENPYDVSRDGPPMDFPRSSHSDAHSTTGSDGLVMMTPPVVDQAMGNAAVTGPGSSVGITPAGSDSQDMDWSSLSGGFLDSGGVPSLNAGFGGFGVMGGLPGMGSMGGGGSQDGRNMYGN